MAFLTVGHGRCRATGCHIQGSIALKRYLLLCLAIVARPVAAQADPTVILARKDLVEDRCNEALSMLRAAVKVGDRRATALLGAASVRGWGVTAYRDEAIRLYERASYLGYPRSMYIVRQVYRHGDGTVALDPRRARAEHIRAVALDYPPALAEYGSILTHGEGEPAEPELGVTYFRMSAQVGDSNGMN